MRIPYVYVPITALFCYGFMLITLLAAKKNKVINSFINILVAFILWTAGSFFMRLRLYPGVDFWFEVSTFGLFCLPLLYYNFVYNFVGSKDYLLKAIWTVCTVVILILNYLHAFLQHPQVVDLGDGQASFIYTMRWPVIIPAIFTTLVILSIIRMIYNDVRQNEADAGKFIPVIIGTVILFLGNLADIIPAVGVFPGDTLSGIINAFFLFYALYRGRLFNLTLVVSQGTTYIISAVFITLFFAYFVQPMEKFIVSRFPALETAVTLVIAVFFALCIIGFYRLTKKIIDNIFVREEMEQAAILKNFSQEAAKSLNLEEILEAIIQAVKQGVKSEKVYICLPDEKRQLFSVARSLSPLDSRAFQISSTNPCVEWLAKHNSTILIKDLQSKTIYKAMWQSEKKQLADLEIECLVPLKYEEELAGILLLSKKEKKRSYTYDDINFLESIKSVGSIAIQNARLYAKAYQEARYDDLTGLLNRKYFYHAIQEQFDNSRSSSLGLVIVNLDNFKLYNQLYGFREGDVALRKIAQIIKSSIGCSDIAARYSGKEFAIILPGYDVLSAVQLAENIRQKVAVMNEEEEVGVLKVLTVSCGVCVYPYSAATVKELIDNADMAVYNAKRSGKNKVEVYSMREPDSVTSCKSPLSKPDVYNEYSATIYALTAAIDVKDHYTFNHSQNVADYAVALAEKIALNSEHIEIIREAALLHDIGKIGVPEHILNKEGKLTPQEYEIMKKHVEYSINMIRHLPSLDYVVPAVLGHHERWDGRGYPRGLSGEDIPLAARCLAIADAFDAMTTHRSYKKALPIEYALQEIIRQAGRQFDPYLAEVFVGLIKDNTIKVKA